MFILNERDFIRNLLVSKQKPTDISTMYLAKLIAKYYYRQDITSEELQKIVKEKLLEFNIDFYQEYLYAPKIKNVCNQICASYCEDMTNIFRELDYVPIYESEIKIIETLPSERHKKYLFTVYAIARYMNSNGWINKKDYKGMMEVFKLANIKLPERERGSIIHYLYKNGYITLSKKVDNLNVRVELVDDGEIAYKVKEFVNLGNQYLGAFKPGFKMCETPGCGRLFRKNGKNNRYCRICSNERNLKRHIKYNEHRQ